MKSKKYPCEVYVLRKRVNYLSEGRQVFPSERVNLFCIGEVANGRGYSLITYNFGHLDFSKTLRNLLNI